MFRPNFPFPLGWGESPRLVKLTYVSSPTTENVVILGSGPAGYTAALYAARAGLKPVVFAGPTPGGQLTITTDVENYPGYPEGRMGPDMMVDFRVQAERFGARVIEKTATRVDLSQRPFRVQADDEQVLAETLIVATGAVAKWTGVPGETEFGGRGVSACATCDGFFFRGKEVVVIGGGDTAMEEATCLTRHASKVTVIHRRDTLRASKVMQERAFSNPKIDFIWNTVLEEVMGERQPVPKVNGVRLRNVETDEVTELRTDGVFIAIGHSPNSQLFQGVLDMDELGYIRVQPFSTRTNVEGVFACGDVADKVYRQAVTAAGTGCMAALDAERYLEAKGHGS